MRVEMRGGYCALCAITSSRYGRNVPRISNKRMDGKEPSAVLGGLSSGRVGGVRKVGHLCSNEESVTSGPKLALSTGSGLLVSPLFYVIIGNKYVWSIHSIL